MKFRKMDSWPPYDLGIAEERKNHMIMLLATIKRCTQLREVGLSVQQALHIQ
jgi:hypothetical protein